MPVTNLYFARRRYNLLTLDPETGKYTPQAGLSVGGYQLTWRELLQGVSELERMGYAIKDQAVLIERVDHKAKGA